MTHEYTQHQKAFLTFARAIREGEEGVFFSCNDPLVGKKWYFGFGQKTVVDFEHSSPVFSCADFLGKNIHSLTFEHFYDSDTTLQEAMLPNFVDLELSFLENSKQEDNFLSKVKKLQSAQQSGEAWVVNLAEDFGVSIDEEISNVEVFLSLFWNFLKLNKTHCGGVWLTKEQKFCSFSPEIFCHQKESVLSTFPIKGTGTKSYLESSQKEISELAMVTDLMRNDLGKICERVLVRDERFLRKESGFYHARSLIEGELPRPLDLNQYKALLPAGSISGAPKKRVIELIEGAEDFDRKFFTGTFGVKQNNEGLFNILIRTLFIDVNGNYHFPVGAGITVESDPEEEWKELLAKRAILLKCAQYG